MANGQVATPAGSGTSHARKFGIFTQGEDVVIKALFVWKLIGFWGRGKGGILARWKTVATTFFILAPIPTRDGIFWLTHVLKG